MKESTGARIGIVASIVGAVGAIVYLSRKPAGSTIVQGSSGTVGPAGAPGIGIPGAAGLPGLAGAAGAAGAAGRVTAATGGSPAAPSGQSLTQYFVDQFYPPAGGALKTRIESNVPTFPAGVAYSGIAGASGKAGCGCGGGCGSKGAGSSTGACGGGKCPNTPAPFIFPDGHGACASTTVGRLQASMDRCVPDNLPASLSTMMGNMAYMSIDSTPDLESFRLSVANLLQQVPGPVLDARFTPMPWVPGTSFTAA